MALPLTKLTEKLQALRAGQYRPENVSTIIELLCEAERETPGTLDQLGTNRQELDHILKGASR